MEYRYTTSLGFDKFCQVTIITDGYDILEAYFTPESNVGLPLDDACPFLERLFNWSKSLKDEIIKDAVYFGQPEEEEYECEY